MTSSHLSSSFEPIAIVGRDTLFPGVNSASGLGEAIFTQQNLLGDVPADRWRVDHDRVVKQPGGDERDRSRTKRGGYVTDFSSRFDPSRFPASGVEFAGLDPAFQWAVELARGALDDIGPRRITGRTSAIIGLLSFPTSGMARFAEHVWGALAPDSAGAQSVRAEDRFMSGLPALLVKEALGLDGEAFALDAACASSLYAIKLGCDLLQSRRTDLVVAGAVNRADDLFIHIGFTALGALSPSGQSRPFHAGADGLVPSEGAGFVALCRYEDAVAEGLRIYGVIRGVGLANDGRGRGLLAPSQEGQSRCMQAALHQAGFSPKDINLIECHATGTPVGDATELGSLTQVYGSNPGLTIGSIKSNLGHPITAAGIAGLTKILEAFERGQKPPTRHEGQLSPALEQCPFRLLQEIETFNGPRRAALSAFGFGGNDAHLIVEAPEETAERSRPQVTRSVQSSSDDPVAVVAVSLHAGPAESTEAALQYLLHPAPSQPQVRSETVHVSLAGLRFPPKDLEASLAQQKAVISALQDALRRSTLKLEGTNSGVFVGMGCDPEVARWGARWRLPDDDPRRDLFAPTLTAAAVVGTMPNMPANRISSLLDLHGPSFTVSAEEASGLVALRLGIRALVAQEIDCAVVAATDFSDEPVHRAALAQLSSKNTVPGDGVALFILMRASDAKAAHLPVWAWVNESASLTNPNPSPSVTAARFGTPHAASSLMDLAAHTLLLGVRHEAGGRSLSSVEPQTFVHHDMRGHPLSVQLSPADTFALPHSDAPWPSVRDQAHLSHPTHPPVMVSNNIDTRLSVELEPSRSGTPAMSTHDNPLGPQTQAESPRTQLTPASADATSPPSSEGQKMEPPPVLPSVFAETLARTERPYSSSSAEITNSEENELTPSQPNPSQLNPFELDSSSQLDSSSSLGIEAGHPQASSSFDDEVFSLFIEHRQALDEAHQDFLVTQSQIQNQFLSIQQRAFETLAAHATAFEETPPEPDFTFTPWVIETPPAQTTPTAPLDPQIGGLGSSWSSSPASPRPTSVTEDSATREVEGLETRAPSVEVLSPSSVRVEVLSPSSVRTVHDLETPQAAKTPTKKAAQTSSSGFKKPNLRPVPSPTPTRCSPKGPAFDRKQLMVHASGAVSEIFGTKFKIQDSYHRQVRMPEPPLLLADRVTGIDAEPGSMTTGTIWTETDITEESWYLHEGHMPAGVMIEAGQADLMLISYLGCDFENRGERIYRLLGCDLTYHGSLPSPGDRLEYEIHVDGHAEQGPIRIFFFHYDGWIRNERRISVRGGQAGFFTDKELSESGGILWSAEDNPPPEDGQVAPPVVHSTQSSFDENEVISFSNGDAYGCFGAGFERLATHTRTPRISGGEMVFFDTVDDFNPTGGPWGRGYLRARRKIRPDDWFFEGHFKNDPCMPGTLMFEGCLQTMAFYLTAMGYTLNRDGWRFEPIPEKTYRLRCRGQVTPESKDLTYEVYVREVWHGDEPTLYADLMCTVDGLKAFHAEDMGLRLIPDWPLDQVGASELAREPFPGARAPAVAGGVTFNLDPMLSCAWGQPSRAFGPMYARFDSARKVPRLPGPPYHFMSRVVSVPESAMGAFEAGVDIEVEYDIPPDAWYFEDSSTGHMPFAVLLEAALQPCGWLASYIGSTLQADQDLFFRNLDGTGTTHREIGPHDGILMTQVRLERVAKTGDMIIVGFSVKCHLKSELVYEMDTVFGFFPEESLQSQAGLPTTDELRAQLTRPSDVKISTDESFFTAGSSKLSTGLLRLLDRVTGWWPSDGEAGLGCIRAEMDVQPNQWFFAAHFFQDPVQPGSLGIEAMLDTLRAAVLLKSGQRSAANQRFEVLGMGTPLTWKYRGQVLPENAKVEVTLEITADESSSSGSERRFEAKGSLWVDGKRIYEARGLSARLVPADNPAETHNNKVWTLDPQKDTWLQDHCPTWTTPAVPMMVFVDWLAELAGGPPVRLENIRLRGWVVVDRVRQLKGQRDDTRLSIVDEANNVVVDARIGRPTTLPVPLSPLEDGVEQAAPYDGGGLFHGPSFQVMKQWIFGAAGATGRLERSEAPKDAQSVPVGVVDPLLLDGGTHTIPHDRMDRWSTEIGPDRVAYPARIESIEFYGPTPTHAWVETRFMGCPAGPSFPVFHMQWLNEARQVWAEAHFMESTFPKGPIGKAAPTHRQAFLTGIYTPEASLSSFDKSETSLRIADVKLSDWLPGTIEAVYGSQDPETIAVLEHRGRLHQLHPRDIDRKLPYTRDPIEIIRSGPVVKVRSTGPSTLDLTAVEGFWRTWFNREPWLVEDLYYGLIKRFVRRVVVEDPEGIEALKGRAVLFLSNHQTMIESLLFSIVVSALIEKPTVTLAKEEHRVSWLGTLIHHCFSYPRIRDPEVIMFFDREDKASLPGIIAKLGMQLAANEKAVMIHVEGTRALHAGHRIERMSGSFLELAIQTGVSVVPLWFEGGLPSEPLAQRTDFPLGMGQQDIRLGAPFSPEKLAELPYGPRKVEVIQALNSLGDSSIRGGQTPFSPDPQFEERVRERIRTGNDESNSVLMEVLLEQTKPRAEYTARLIDAARTQRRLDLTSSPEDIWFKTLAERLLGPQ